MINKKLTASEKVAYLELVKKSGENNIMVKQPDFYDVTTKEFYEVKKVVKLKNGSNTIYFGKEQYYEFKKANPFIICIENDSVLNILRLDELEKNNFKVKTVNS